MRELDAGQRKELDALLAAARPWLDRSMPMRLLLLLPCVAPTSLVVTGIAYLATDRWPLVSASITGFMFACLLPNIVAPEWAIRFYFRLWSVSDTDAAKPKMGP